MRASELVFQLNIIEHFSIVLMLVV